MSELIGKFFYYLNSLQKDLNAEISSAFRAVDESGFTGVAILLGLSFIYGVVHAIGPGHGKAVVSSYFLNHNKNYFSAIKIGYMIAIIHATSALIITFVIYYLLDVLFTKTFSLTTDMMYKISGGLILAVGLYLLWDHFKAHKHESVKKGKELAVALSIGIAPCPGVMTVMLFAIMLKHLAAGVLAAIVMSIGMGLTITLFGIFANRISKEGERSQKLIKTLSLLSPVLIIMLGVFLLI